MATRFDITEKLIHFTRGESPSEAFARLQTIIANRRLIAGSRMIRGGYRCVCFTEAPLAAFTGVFVRRAPFSRYSQFGLMFEKSWVYGCGGRPVFYQAGGDFDILPEELRWLHVRFEPTAEPAIDFTWEREWRVRCGEMPFSSAEAVIVVPDDQWAEALRRRHDAEQDFRVEQYANVFEQELAELWREPFSWRVVALQ